MKSKEDLLGSIVDTIKDYREGEIVAPTPERVDCWVQQFDAEVQVPLLAELDHVLKRTYFNRMTVLKFLAKLVTNADLAGSDVCTFWKNVHFLNNQGGGNSQRQMLRFFDAFLQRHCGFPINDCSKITDTFIYIDDAIFTGNRVLKDLDNWIQTEAPIKAKVHIITIALHRGGQFYIKNKISEKSALAKKDIKLYWWRCAEIEDRKAYINHTDVLRPRTIPTDPLVLGYISSLKYPLGLRTQDSIGEHGFFSSEHGRALLEQEMLKAGVKIRELCPSLNKYQRPLGNMILETLGFGSTIVTFRNCPNNAPLAFWAGHPWHPLFERKAN